MTNEQIKEKYGEERLNEILEARKQYYQKNREKRLAYQKNYDSTHNRNTYFREYMRHYQKCGVLFSYVIDCNPEQIENYELAKADDFEGWHCHHRLETHTADGNRRKVDLSREELIAMNMYYNRPANELIFMKAGEHISLHKKGGNK